MSFKQEVINWSIRLATSSLTERVLDHSGEFISLVKDRKFIRHVVTGRVYRAHPDIEF